MAGPETRTRGRKSPRCGAPRGAASRSQGTSGRLASAPARRVTQAANACVTRRATGASQAPGADRRSPTPHGVGNWKNPGAIASRERVVLRAGLFDIVRLDAPRQSASWRRCEEARGRCELATLLGAGVRTGAPADLVYAIARREI